MSKWKAEWKNGQIWKITSRINYLSVFLMRLLDFISFLLLTVRDATSVNMTDLSHTNSVWKECLAQCEFKRHGGSPTSSTSVTRLSIHCTNSYFLSPCIRYLHLCNMGVKFYHIKMRKKYQQNGAYWYFRDSMCFL